MSAGAVGGFAPQPIRMPSHTTRPPLRLVGPGERAGPGACACARSPRTARLTRRGRLVITLVGTVAGAPLAMVLAAPVDAPAPQIAHATPLSAGQPLSGGAAARLPSLPI